MSCKYCGSTGYHHPMCPNYISEKCTYYCSICDDGICDGEDYVVNVNDEYVHYDCLTNVSYCEMIKWLGGEIKEMDDDYGEDY